MINIWAPSEGDRDEALVSMRNNDVVVNFPSTFGIEIILSDTLLTFPEFGGRTNGRVIVRETKPLIFIEIFEFQGQPLLSERFPTPIDWLENSNFFVNHPGRI